MVLRLDLALAYDGGRTHDKNGRPAHADTNVFLTEHFDSLIVSGIESGQFSDASEVAREGLRLLEQRQQEDKAKIEWLRGAVKEGLDEIERGEGIAFASMDDFADEIRAIGEEASKELAAGSARG